MCVFKHQACQVIFGKPSSVTLNYFPAWCEDKNICSWVLFCFNMIESIQNGAMQIGVVWPPVTPIGFKWNIVNGLQSWFPFVVCSLE